MMNNKYKEGIQSLISTNEVEKLMLTVRGQSVLLDREVAMLYGVETKRVNEAVKNNLEKFPEGYILELDEKESSVLRSKFFTLEQREGRGRHSKYNVKAFTERSLYVGDYFKISKSSRGNSCHHRHLYDDKAIGSYDGVAPNSGRWRRTAEVSFSKDRRDFSGHSGK